MQTMASYNITNLDTTIYKIICNLYFINYKLIKLYNIHKYNSSYFIFKCPRYCKMV